MTTRRDFLRALALGTGAILVPQYGRWHRQGSGVLIGESGIAQLAREYGDRWIMLSPYREVSLKEIEGLLARAKVRPDSFTLYLDHKAPGGVLSLVNQRPETRHGGFRGTSHTL